MNNNTAAKQRIQHDNHAFRQITNHRRSNRYILVSIICAIVSLSGCKPDQQTNSPVRSKKPFQVMGTLAELTAIAPDQKTADQAIQAGIDAITKVESLMSAFDPESEVGQMNTTTPGTPVAVSQETFEVIQASLRFSEISGGAFDITCKPLLKTWKTAMKEGRLPTPDELQNSRKRVSWKAITLDPDAGTVTKSLDEMTIDLGAIAKGYSLDLAARAMQNAGATAGVVNVGGDVLTFGLPLDTDHWYVGIQNPFEQGVIDKLIIDGRAVATSGVQHRFFKIDGKHYSHIIDPRTGQPAEQAPSVTVIAPDGMTADALATVFSVLSVKEGQDLAQTLDDVEVFWVWGDRDNPETARTPNFNLYEAR